MKKKTKLCYNTLVKQLDNMDTQICQLKEQIKKLKSCFVVNEKEEVCQDEIDADKAATEAINEICLDSLLDLGSQGEA